MLSIRRYRATIAMVTFVIAVAMTLAVSNFPFVAPFGFLVTLLVAWDHGLAASLTWVVAIRLAIPATAIALGIGPFFVFASAQGAMVVFMITYLLAEIAVALLAVRLKRLTEELRQSRQTLSVVNDRLQAAIDEVKELRGFLPICAWCKDIMDISGTWERIESYVTRHSRATFTHGVCPKCMEEQLRKLDA